MQTCQQCKRKYTPSSKHKVCPRCRNNNAKKKCECGNIMARNSKRCIRCHNKRIAGMGAQGRTPKPEGHKYQRKNGYVMIKSSNHPRASKNYVFEHILVMENKLDRYLDEGETVHHINGIKDDNRIENLELWIRPQPTGIRAKDAVVWAKEILKKYEDINV